MLILNGGWEGGTMVGNAVVVWCGGGGIKKLIVVCQTRTLHQSSSIAPFYIANVEK